MRDYGTSILWQLRSTEWSNSQGLEKHEIKGKHRKQMVEWMRDVLEVFKSPVEVLYKAVTIMDHYFDQKQGSLRIEELHEVGIASILLASKYTELEPLSVELMHKKASHGKISEKAIWDWERDILNTVNFELAAPSFYDFLENYLETLIHKFSELKD